ncbi:single-stranded DNA-binding protein [Comamonas thiooxydans]|uniref:single-stranded DNA-binding protein n=1 Tax=Comamonas thiooxydans TaxID=363952 RepID=UPI0009B80B21|nr:single-stranded DNA-binding protein [Comamonas thiooxydans]
MASVNKVIIVGNLGKDPVCRNGNNGNGQLFANLSVATTEHWTDQASQEPRERTEWHSIVLRGRLAEIARDYLHKGAQVYLEGTLRTRKWTDQASGVERFITEVHCDSMQMLGSPNQGAGGRAQAPARAPSSSRPAARAPAPAQGRGQGSRAANSQPTRGQGGGGGSFDDDIPFARLHYMAGG